MSISNVELIVITEVGTLLKKDKTFEENLTIAMKCAKNHWLCPPDIEKFNGAVVAVGKFYGIDSLEYRRLEKASKQLRAIQSLQGGIMPDLEALEASLPSDEEVPPIALRTFWDNCDKPPEAKGGFIQ